MSYRNVSAFSCPLLKTVLPRHSCITNHTKLVFTRPV